MSIQLDPPELGFRRPFTREVTQLLRLGNPSNDPMAFKVKTTAPKQYCVRPNSGRIEPGGEVEVQVLLQAMREDPPLDARCRDKFLVQSVAITPDKESSNIATIWQNVEQTSKAEIQERKIRVVFLPASGAPTSTPNHSNVNGAHHGEEAPPAYGSATPYGSPAPNVANPATNSTNARSTAIPMDSGAVQEPTSNVASTAQSSLFNAASSVTNTLPTSGDDVRQQLADAKATIARLTDQAQEQVLRQRKSDAVNQDSKERITTGTTGMGVQQQPADGVPVQIVAALCLLSFLLAYFFF
ncbi:MAG: phosphatidylinositol-binding protein scs2 [Heterodermia speciosa]|uniref:Phosphatidylinositol-binding protein scs2 n=1 Tax=Heterodermia speciosa TaxID=116794 RepID=A0A8H3FTH4_9LECA|nr:MAG: phosphatidylinositol-binding protein scs2 [Heterodermia speciosa]